MQLLERLVFLTMSILSVQTTIVALGQYIAMTLAIFPVSV